MRTEGLTVLLTELEQCVPAGQNTESAVEAILLGDYISNWLETLSADDRALFDFRAETMVFQFSAY